MALPIKTTNQKMGQTLIETLAALFILVMGISASVGLAVYALNSSNTIVKQIVAVGLAREGLEAVRNMRDTNWLKDTLVVKGCYDYATSANLAADCYKNWLGDLNNNVVPFCLNPSNTGNCNGSATYQYYNLGFDSTLAKFWDFQVVSSNQKNYGLVFNSNSSDPSNPSRITGFYSPGVGIKCDDSAGRSDYCRKIVLTVLKTSDYAPYNKDLNLPLLQVQSQVWWKDKKCPRVDDWPGSGNCSIELDSYLTNWKNK